MKVGDTVFLKPLNAEGRTQVITAEGAVYLWTDDGVGIDPHTRDLYANGRNYVGKAYENAEAYQREQTVRSTWREFASMVLRTRGAPRGVGIEEIEAAARCLGWKL
jgi:hypothetical protein